MYQIEKKRLEVLNSKTIKISESEMHVRYIKNSKDINCLKFQTANKDFFSEF